jgi:hypothetical protein
MLITPIKVMRGPDGTPRTRSPKSSTRLAASPAETVKNSKIHSSIDPSTQPKSARTPELEEREVLLLLMDADPVKRSSVKDVKNLRKESDNLDNGTKISDCYHKSLDNRDKSLDNPSTSFDDCKNNDDYSKSFDDSRDIPDDVYSVASDMGEFTEKGFIDEMLLSRDLRIAENDEEETAPSNVSHFDYTTVLKIGLVCAAVCMDWRAYSKFLSRTVATSSPVNLISDQRSTDVSLVKMAVLVGAVSSRERLSSVYTNAMDAFRGYMARPSALLPVLLAPITLLYTCAADTGQCVNDLINGTMSTAVELIEQLIQRPKAKVLKATALVFISIVAIGLIATIVSSDQ